MGTDTTIIEESTVVLEVDRAADGETSSRVLLGCRAAGRCSTDHYSDLPCYPCSFLVGCAAGLPSQTRQM